MKLKINNQAMVEFVWTEPTDKPMVTIENDKSQEDKSMWKYREISEDRNIPQRMFTLENGNQTFLNPTGYEVWTEEDTIGYYEYADDDGNYYYARGQKGGGLKISEGNIKETASW